MVQFVSFQYALSVQDPFALAIMQRFPHAVDWIDQDMSLVADVYQNLSLSSGNVDQARLALAAAGRLQGVALLLQLGVVYQHYALLVKRLTDYLYDLDMYLRMLPC